MNSTDILLAIIAELRAEREDLKKQLTAAEVSRDRYSKWWVDAQDELETLKVAVGVVVPSARDLEQFNSASAQSNNGIL